MWHREVPTTEHVPGDLRAVSEARKGRQPAGVTQLEDQGPGLKAVSCLSAPRPGGRPVLGVTVTLDPHGRGCYEHSWRRGRAWGLRFAVPCPRHSRFRNLPEPTNISTPEPDEPHDSKPWTWDHRPPVLGPTCLPVGLCRRVLPQPRPPSAHRYQPTLC